MKKNRYTLIVILAVLFCCYLSESMAGNRVSDTKDMALPSGQRQVGNIGRGETEKVMSKGVHPKRVVRELHLGLDKLYSYPVNVNDRVFAIEKIECNEHSGDWILYYEGTVTSMTDGKISVKLKKRFAYRYSPKKEGVDKTTWWPMKRHSYLKVKFSDWSGTYVKGQVVSFPEKMVFNARIRVVNGILMALKDECKRGTH